MVYDLNQWNSKNQKKKSLICTINFSFIRFICATLNHIYFLKLYKIIKIYSTTLFSVSVLSSKTNNNNNYTYIDDFKYVILFGMYAFDTYMCMCFCRHHALETDWYVYMNMLNVWVWACIRSFFTVSIQFIPFSTFWWKILCICAMRFFVVSLHALISFLSLLV